MNLFIDVSVPTDWKLYKCDQARSCLVFMAYQVHIHPPGSVWLGATGNCKEEGEAGKVPGICERSGNATPGGGWGAEGVGASPGGGILGVIACMASGMNSRRPTS